MLSIFRITDEGVETLYDDRLRPFLAGRDYTLQRASHVDPLPRPGWRDYCRDVWTVAGRRRLAQQRQWAGVCFGIFWQPPFRRQFGRCTFVDANGCPFVTRQAAIDYEIALLQRTHFRW